MEIWGLRRVGWTLTLMAALVVAFAGPAAAQAPDCDDVVAGDCAPAEGSQVDEDIDQVQESDGSSIQQQDDQVDDASISAGGDIERSQTSVTDQRVGSTDLEDDDRVSSARVRVLARTGPHVPAIVVAGLLCLLAGVALRPSRRASPG